MSTTSRLSLPYPPLTGVTPNVPRDIQALAERLDDVVPSLSVASGSLSTSSASLVDIPSASVTVTVDVATLGIAFIAVAGSISPSGAGDAKVNLSIDGADFGQVMQVNAGGAASTQRWMIPGSTVGNAVAGATVFTQLPAGSRTVKLRALSTSGSASFVGSVFLWMFLVA